MASVLMVVPEAAARTRLAEGLRGHGCRVQECAGLAAGRAALAEAPPEVLVLSFQLADGDEIGWLKALRQDSPGLPVVMVTASPDNGLAVAAMREGAYDFLREPVAPDELASTVARAAGLRHEARRPVAPPVHGDEPASLVGRSRAIVEVCKQIGRIAPTGASVLIVGESGTGKEIVARALHAHSGCPGPFQPVNCAAIVDTLLESELFGHEKGSFTGAIASKPGKFELAGHGVLFLDEIGELSPQLQAKLLRVLQEGVYERVGGTRSLTASARIVAASNRNLAACVRERQFRADLYYRVNVVSIALPPLREHMEDLPMLVDHLLGRIAGRLARPALRLSAPALHRLAAHSWPGNVRELENLLTRAVIMSHGDIVGPEAFEAAFAAAAPAQPAAMPAGGPPPAISLAELEARHVAAVLAHTRWHRGRACALLGISRPALERKIRKYHLEAEPSWPGDETLNS